MILSGMLKPSHNPYGNVPSRGRPRVFESVENRRYAYCAYYYCMASYKEIGAYFGTSGVVVKNLFKLMHWPARDRSAARNRNGRLSAVAMHDYSLDYQSGVSIAEIAANAHVAPKRISAYLKQTGVFESRTITARRNASLSLAKPHATHRDRQANSPYNSVVTNRRFKLYVQYLTKVVGVYLLGPAPAFPRNLIGTQKPEVDHILSISDAYYTPRRIPVTAFELAHPCNLQWLTPGQNKTKGSRSDLTAGALRKRIAVYNAQNGDPFAGRALKYIPVLTLEEFDRQYGR